TKRTRFFKMLKSILIFLLVVGGIFAAGWFIELDRRASAGGYLTTDLYAEVRSPVAGQVVDILAASGQVVEKGAPLVQLDDTSQRSDVAEREKALLKSRAELALREAELADKRRQIELQVEAAELTRERAEARLELTRQLAERGLAAARELNDDSYQLKAAETELRRLRAFDAEVDEREIGVLRCEVEVREEALNRARADLDRMTVRAPIDGLLSRYTFYVGEVIRPDTLLYEVFGGTNRVLRLRVPERYATKIKPDQPIRAVLSSEKTFPPRYLRGKVEVLRNVIQSDGTTGYRLVYCSLDTEDRDVPPGSTADADITYGRANFWVVLFGL
ncbi:MAG: HlyD family efflux transporter periplasmic adaptor subunit, partial [Kiritimatiellaeota bacterium]|nr:HlyD family efflux transporter periplasmic adaptor subunit [Kiritimatiellota bacterium]